METTENNKLIAEFMGFEPITEEHFLDNGFENDKQMIIDTHDCKYNSSWDWLMPVVQKCYKIDNEEMFDNLVDAVSTLDIDTIYNEVIEFIKSHNKNLVG
jgi:hypothetical protein